MLLKTLATATAIALMLATAPALAEVNVNVNDIVASKALCLTETGGHKTFRFWAGETDIKVVSADKCMIAPKPMLMMVTRVIEQGVDKEGDDFAFVEVTRGGETKGFTIIWSFSLMKNRKHAPPMGQEV
jgi:hypothetical protein